MIAEEQATGEAGAASEALWCYLVSLGGRLCAVPDDDRTVLLPFISTVPQVTPLPVALVPAYVIGLINIAQRGELLVDLPRLLGMRDGPLAPSLSEGRRVVVIGEGTPPETEGHRIAFAVDFGYELVEVVRSGTRRSHPLGVFVREVLSTPRGEAALLDMEVVCNAVLHDMQAARFWNEIQEGPEELEEA